MNQLDARDCPVCGRPLSEPPSRRDRPGADLAFYSCRHCGRFGLTRHAAINLANSLDLSHDSHGRRAPTFAHALQRMQMGQEWPLVDARTVAGILSTAVLPSVAEQADNLIRWLGEHLPGPGAFEQVSHEEHGAIVGTLDKDGFLFIVNGLEGTGLVQTDRALRRTSVTLTFAGWERWEELRRGAPSGTKAFMAMQYGDATLTRIVDEHLRPAVAETGFRLTRLDDEPKAGPIDNRLRVEIQSARFLIADLTHGNKGAYWEAGYAEGLGKPVIYTCEESIWKEKKTHFDTNHSQTVVWNVGDLKTAIDQLKATIRVSIPEAKREDD